MNNDLIVELTINSDIQRFENWLDRYRLHTLPFLIEQGDDSYLAIIGAPTFRADYRGMRRHEIDAENTWPDPNNPQGEIHSYPFIVIEIELSEPSDNRVNLNFKCKHSLLLPYCVEMLNEIAKLWPETRRELLFTSQRYKEWTELGNLLNALIEEDERKEMTSTRIELPKSDTFELHSTTSDWIDYEGTQAQLFNFVMNWTKENGSKFPNVWFPCHHTRIDDGDRINLCQTTKYKNTDGFDVCTEGDTIGQIDVIEVGFGSRLRYKYLTTDSESFISALVNYITPTKTISGMKKPKKIGGKREPNTRTQNRYAVFQSLKEENPGWTQYKVAMESVEILREDVSADTVRNTYRLMGKKWERADRIR